MTQKGTPGLGEFATQQPFQPELAPKVGEHVGRLSQLLGITDIDLHVEEVAGADKSLDVVVDIFNRVNSGGTNLSKGDLAFAKICAEWPEGRDAMKAKLKEWANSEYHFNLDWPLRSVNTVLTGEAKFQFLHEIERGRGSRRPRPSDQAHRHHPQPYRRAVGAGSRSRFLRSLCCAGNGTLPGSAAGKEARPNG